MAGKRGQRGTKPRTAPPKFQMGWLAAVDRRYSGPQAAIRAHEALAEALGGDLSPQQAMLAERVIWAHARLQQLEQRFLADGELDTKDWTQLTNTLIGLTRTLGLERVAKPAEGLQAYMKRVAAEKAVEAQAVP